MSEVLPWFTLAVRANLHPFPRHGRCRLLPELEALHRHMTERCATDERAAGFLEYNYRTTREQRCRGDQIQVRIRLNAEFTSVGNTVYADPSLFACSGAMRTDLLLSAEKTAKRSSSSWGKEKETLCRFGLSV